MVVDKLLSCFHMRYVMFNLSSNEIKYNRALLKHHYSSSFKTYRNLLSAVILNVDSRNHPAIHLLSDEKRPDCLKRAVSLNYHHYLTTLQTLNSTVCGFFYQQLFGSFPAMVEGPNGQSGRYICCRNNIYVIRLKLT